MANFYTGGIDMFNARVYSENHPNTVNFIENQLQNASHAITTAGQEFMAQARDRYDAFNGSEAMRLARGAARQLTSHWNRNVVRPLTDVPMLQQAPMVMQRYLMAEPTTRSLYHKQQCDGYSETYYDMEPDQIGEDHYDYRRAMNGMVTETEDGGWCYTEYLDELHDGDRELMFEEQFDIQRSWRHLLDAMLDKKDDPTSPWNAEL
jgi:hypothetical protein